MAKTLGRFLEDAGATTATADAALMPRAEYGEIIGIFDNVRVKLPKMSERMREVEPHLLPVNGGLMPVDFHFEHKDCLLGMGGFVQRNLYGFRAEDLGKSRVATVTARYKITAESKKKVLLLDITKSAEGAKAETVMKIIPKNPWDVGIPCGGGIRFVPVDELPKKEKKAEE